MDTEVKEEISTEVKDIPKEDISEKQPVDEIKELLSEDSEDSEEVIDDKEEEPQTAKKEKKKKEKDEDIVEERVYTIPLGRALVRPPKKRAPRAITLIREFVIRHMKIDLSAKAEEERGELPILSISNAVNEKIWSRSIKKPPRKIRIRATKDKDGNVKIFLAEGE